MLCSMYHSLSVGRAGRNAHHSTARGMKLRAETRASQHVGFLGPATLTLPPPQATQAILPTCPYFFITSLASMHASQCSATLHMEPMSPLELQTRAWAGPRPLPSLWALSRQKPKHNLSKSPAYKISFHHGHWPSESLGAQGSDLRLASLWLQRAEYILVRLCRNNCDRGFSAH